MISPLCNTAPLCVNLAPGLLFIQRKGGLVGWLRYLSPGHWWAVYWRGVACPSHLETPEFAGLLKEEVLELVPDIYFSKC